MKIAVLGASGFVGTRLLEKWILTGHHEVVPVVRGYGSLAPIAKLPIEPRVADARDADALSDAFAGCDAVVHAALGDPRQIVAMSRAVTRAVAASGVRRLVVLSSAVSLGMVPQEGSDEDSPLQTRGPMNYCRAKALAEREFERFAGGKAGRRTKVVQLRPFLVYGPRSKLFYRLIQNLREGQWEMVDQGRGVFNGIYVDNLIHAIERALEGDVPGYGVYHVNDREPVSWHDCYAKIARHLGVSVPEEIPDAPVAALSVRTSWTERIRDFATTPFMQPLTRCLPGRAKRILRAALEAWPEPRRANPWQLPDGKPIIDRELSLLQQCRWRFSCEKAMRELGYDPPVSFDEGVKRTLGWYAFLDEPPFQNRR